MRPTARRLARTIDDRIQGALPQGAIPAGITWGTVVSIQAGPPKSLTLTVGGSSTSIAGFRYLSSYTPTVGDVVAILVAASGDLLVLGTRA